MTPHTVAVLTVKMVVLARIDNQRNLTFSSRTDLVVCTYFHVWHILFNKIQHDGACSTFRHIERISGSAERTGLMKLGAATVCIVIICPTFVHQFRVNDIHTV